MLIGEAQYAMLAEREQDLPEVALTQRLRQIDPVSGRSEHRTRRFNGQHRTPPPVTFPRLAQVNVVAPRQQCQPSRRARLPCGLRRSRITESGRPLIGYAPATPSILRYRTAPGAGPGGERPRATSNRPRGSSA